MYPAHATIDTAPSPGPICWMGPPDAAGVAVVVAGSRPPPQASEPESAAAPAVHRKLLDMLRLWVLNTAREDITRTVSDKRFAAGPEAHFPSESAGRSAHAAQPLGVHAPQVVERAERHPVLRGVRASGGAEADVVVVQVLHRRAARHGTEPAVAGE